MWEIPSDFQGKLRAMVVSARKRLLTVEEYDRMMESGILAEDERVELIRGEILELAPIGNRHAACLRRLLRILRQDLGPDVLLDVQNPVRLSTQGSQPQPDLALLRQREDGYLEQPPAEDNILLLVEISDSSLVYDRDVKIPLYAQAGVPEVWLVDLQSSEMSIYRRPASQGYQEVQRLKRDEALTCEALPGLRVPVTSVLG